MAIFQRTDYRMLFTRAATALYAAMSLVVVPTNVEAQAVPDGPPFSVVPAGFFAGSSVGMDPAGNFVVVWSAGDGNGLGINARRFTRQGVPLGGTFQVNDYTTDGQSNPHVAVATDGSFIVAWEDCCGRDGDDSGVFARLFDSNGTPLGSDFQLNTQTSGPQGPGDIERIPAGGFLVSWGTPSLRSGNDAYVQRLDSAGAFVGAAISLPSTGPPHIGVSSSGDSVVAFDIGRDYFFQRFDSSGTPLGGQTQMSVIGGDAKPHTAVVPDGRFLLAWDENRLATFQFYDAAGAPLDAALPLAGSPPSPCGGHGIWETVAGGEGGIQVFWSESNCAQEIESFGVRFGPAGARENDFPIDFNPDDAAAAANGDFVIVRGTVAQLFSVANPRLPLFGKNLLIKNAVPDNPLRNKISWKVKDSQVVPGAAETANDPRCNGDPAGSVKASLRFFSPSSGHDTGEIDLPCENWEPLHDPDVRRGYRYLDKTYDDGPCKRVLIADRKRLNAKCAGKVLSLPYDLEEGIDEQTVNVVLTVGNMKYCSAFEPFKGRDGSDGKKFQGKNNPAPLACPEPPSPSGAFLSIDSGALD